MHSIQETLPDRLIESDAGRTLFTVEVRKGFLYGIGMEKQADKGTGAGETCMLSGEAFIDS